VTLDDATGAIYSAFLVEEEGTASTFGALKETFGAHGLPMSLYTDRGSHSFHTAEAGGKIDRSRLTQEGRAPASQPIGANIAGPCIGRCVFVVAARGDVGAESQNSIAGKRGSARA